MITGYNIREGSRILAERREQTEREKKIAALLRQALAVLEAKRAA